MGKHSESDESVLLISPRLLVTLKMLQTPVKMKDGLTGKEGQSH